LGEQYGDLFAPANTLISRKESGLNWYPPNHFRPLVDWTLDDDELGEMKTWIEGPLFQMASLLVHENRGHFAHLNIIGELCAQFRKGILAQIRSAGPEGAIQTVEAYHQLHPAAAKSAWHPDAFGQMDKPEWQQLYVNAEHDGQAGVITIGRESYNGDVDAELNRAIDWLKAANIERVVVTGDFHLSTQMVGADTSEFFPALEAEEKGVEIAETWSRTARRLHDEFRVSVGFVGGKRCLGGFLELMMHCHYLVATEGADLGMPEVTLPVVPGMEGCHWPFRKADRQDWPKLLKLLLEGRSLKARDTVGWLVDFAGPMDESLSTVWKIANEGDHDVPLRQVEAGSLGDIPSDVSGLAPTQDPATQAARKAILDTIEAACGATLSEALAIQARHSAGFMSSRHCQKGVVGAAFTKTMKV
jgi:enoyl-CoA hydratase/carnithine racemase